MMGRNTVKGKVYYYPRVVVTMTDEDVIQRAARVFGTGVYTVPQRKDRPQDKQQWRAQINGSRAAELMSLLRPNMGNRRGKKIDEILRQYGEIESTEIRRARSCSESAKKRWAEHGSRSGKLTKEKR